MPLNFKKKLSVGISIVMFSFFVFVLLPLQQTNAQGATVFGGTISNIIYCACSASLLLTVSAPVPATVIFQMGASVPYMYGQVFRSGPFVLGTYAPGGICLVPGTPCVPRPSMGTITMVGTSL